MKNQGNAKMVMAAILLMSFLVLMAVGPTREGSAQINGGGNMPATPGGQQVKMSFGNEDIFISMHDNPTSRDFMKLLPLSLTLEDYNRTEKVSPLPRKLTSQGAPVGIDPTAGDFTYYAPWGNLAIFYQDFGYSRDLIMIGRIESGLEKLTGQRGDFDVRLELAE